MLYTIAVVLIVLWLLGLVTSYTMGGVIHVLLVIAVVMILVQVIQGHSRPTFISEPLDERETAGTGKSHPVSRRNAPSSTCSFWRRTGRMNAVSRSRAKRRTRA
jgi:hypothetical protein